MKQLLTSFLLFISVLTFAVEPSGYYNAAVGKSGDALRTALQTIITLGHSVTSYDGLYPAYGTTDVNPSTGKIWDVYSNCNFTYGTDENHGTNGAECVNYNREHTTPQSWFSGASPMYSDLFNVYPTDSKVNGERGNYPYGEVASVSYTSGNGSKRGSSSMVEYSGTVFEPINEYKGDLARTYLYMATRYAGLCEKWVSEATTIYGSANLGFTTYGATLYLKWSRLDPVSVKETSRNNAVQAVQHNRNPFIDHPELAEYIWGSHKGEPWSLSSGLDELKIEFSVSPNPVQYELSVQSDEQDLSYLIYNLNGQLLDENSLNISKTIPVGQLKNGMYLIQLKSGNRKSIQKFVVSK